MIFLGTLLFTVNDLVFGFRSLVLGAWFWDDDLWGLVKQTIRFLILYDILYQSSFRLTVRAQNLICCLNMSPPNQQGFSRVN